jgi:hypothetical protein
MASCFFFLYCALTLGDIFTHLAILFRLQKRQSESIGACIKAFEAALKSREPFIRLYIAPIKGSLYINCTNSTYGKVQSFLSTKRGLEHGFGITRIDRIVKKYDGWVQRASEEEVFSSEITIPLPLMTKTEPLVRE